MSVHPICSTPEKFVYGSGTSLSVFSDTCKLSEQYTSDGLFNPGKS